MPGSVVGACAMTAVIDCYGSEWFDAGWYDFNFVSPVYTSDEVNAAGHGIEDGIIECRVLDKDRRLCCTGRAGLGTEMPWPQDPGDNAIFPAAKVGTKFDEKEVIIEPTDVKPLLVAAGDASKIWQTNIPPEHLMPIALRIVDFNLTPTERVRAPGMWAEHALVQYQPLAYGTYRITEHLAAKGSSGRTNFLTFQFHVFDKTGKEVAVGRHKCKFIRDE